MNRINALGRLIEEKKKMKVDKHLSTLSFQPNLVTERSNSRLIENIRS